MRLVSRQGSGEILRNLRMLRKHGSPRCTLRTGFHAAGSSFPSHCPWYHWLCGETEEPPVLDDLVFRSTLRVLGHS